MDYDVMSPGNQTSNTVYLWLSVQIGNKLFPNNWNPAKLNLNMHLSLPLQTLIGFICCLSNRVNNIKETRWKKIFKRNEKMQNLNNNKS